MKPLRIFHVDGKDPRVKQTRDLCKAFQDAYERLPGDRDTLSSAVALLLASMFAATEIDEPQPFGSCSQIFLLMLVIRQVRGFRSGSRLNDR